MLAPFSIPGQLAGRLEVCSPFELLQLSCQLRKFGRLKLFREDGQTGSCAVTEAGVTRADCGHLTHREAVLTFLWWKKGWFVFDEDESTPHAERPIRIPELVMDAVRLADETERRAADIPERTARLRLVEGALPPEDALGCDVGRLFAFLIDHPDRTRAEIEATLPLAPVKIRLGLALLADAGQLVDRVAGVHRPAPATAPRNSWWQRLIGSYPGGLRVLIGHPPDASSDALYRAVRKLAETLELPPPSFGMAGDGPSFVRLRPQAGGILSLTFLPVVRKNRYLFESFMQSVQLVLLCADPGAPLEGLDWAAILPKDVGLIPVDCGDAPDTWLYTVLQGLAEATP